MFAVGAPVHEKISAACVHVWNIYCEYDQLKKVYGTARSLMSFKKDSEWITLKEELWNDKQARIQMLKSVNKTSNHLI
jgi:hypothetical protein